MVTKLRLLAALGALVTAVVVVSQSAPSAKVGIPKVQLRSTAAPMDPPATMKSPIVATTDPSPFDPCKDIPFDVISRLGLSFTPPSTKKGCAATTTRATTSRPSSRSSGAITTSRYRPTPSRRRSTATAPPSTRTSSPPTTTATGTSPAW
jgi:hypothetical protein